MCAKKGHTGPAELIWPKRCADWPELSWAHLVLCSGESCRIFRTGPCPRMNIFFLKLIYGEDGNFILDEFSTGLYHREVTFFVIFHRKSATPSGVGEMECVPEKKSVLT